jgi:hypothetical protein|tara:strand:- start:9722 stop:9910 length:189 start_codon:yes stop_codon:yes gene_type:complete
VKVGDLVKHALAHKRENMIGVLLEKVHDPLAMNNDVFSVLWRDGKIGNNVWDYDLVVINESR